MPLFFRRRPRYQQSIPPPCSPDAAAHASVFQTPNRHIIFAARRRARVAHAASAARRPCRPKMRGACGAKHAVLRLYATRFHDIEHHVAATRRAPLILPRSPLLLLTPATIRPALCRAGVMLFSLLFARVRRLRYYRVIFSMVFTPSAATVSANMLFAFFMSARRDVCSRPDERLYRRPAHAICRFRPRLSIFC